MLATLALATALLGAPKNDKAALDSACLQIAHITMIKNWKKLAGLYTPDFQQTDMQGKTIGLRQLEKSIEPLQLVNITYKILTVKSNGKTAEVKAFWTVSGEINDRGIHTLKADDTELDTFKNVNGRWLQSATKILSGSQTVDGRRSSV
jgi:hypothetical protein